MDVDIPELGALNWDQVAASLSELALTWGVRTAGAIAVLVAAWVVSRLVGRWMRDGLSKTKADGTIVSFLTMTVRWLVRLVGLMICLSVFGIEATSLAALLGGAGVAIGIGLKGNLSNLASGLLLLAFRPFTEGDWIEADGRSGKVAKLGLMQTELDSWDNVRHWIPNHKLLEEGLSNREHHAFRRADVEVGVAYDSDLDQVTRVLREVVSELHDDDSGKKPIARSVGFGASSIDFKVGSWCPTPEYFDARHELILAIKKAFDAEGIEIPFPQRDLHLRDAVAVPREVSQAAK